MNWDDVLFQPMEEMVQKRQGNNERLLEDLVQHGICMWKLHEPVNNYNLRDVFIFSFLLYADLPNLNITGVFTTNIYWCFIRNIWMAQILYSACCTYFL